MNRSSLSQMGLILLLSIAVGALFASAEETKQAGSAEKYVTVKEELLFLYVDSPDERFRNAREHVLKQEYAQAAIQVRKGAGFLELEAARATAEGKKALETSIQELKRLAEALEQGTAMAAADLDPIFARAEHALAHHHYLRSSENWGRKEPDKSGRDMEAAAKHFDHARRWAGERLDAGAQATVRETTRLVTLLRKGTGWSLDQVSSALDGLGGGIKRLGGKVKPAELNPEAAKAQMQQVLQALNAYYREHKKYPESLSQLPADTPLSDPYAFRKQLRYAVNPESPATAVIISNGPDWKADYQGRGFNAARPASFPKPGEVYNPSTGRGDLYLYTTGAEAMYK